MIIFIPGELVALVTFPGVIIHEFAHKLFCDLTGTRVYRVAYYVPMAKTSGYVVHEPARSTRVSLLIAMAPFFVNSVLCMLLTIPHGVDYLMPGADCITSSITNLLTWVGFSAGFHAMPSNKDLESIKEPEEGSFADFGACAVAALASFFNLSIVGSFLRIGYAALISVIIPYFLLQ